MNSNNQQVAVKHKHSPQKAAKQQEASYTTQTIAASFRVPGFLPDRGWIDHLTRETVARLRYYHVVGHKCYHYHLLAARVQMIKYD